MNKPVLLLTALMIHCGSTCAQDSSFVTFPSHAAAWSAIVTYQDADATFPRVENAEVTQAADGSRRTILSWSNGQTTETWSSAKWPGLAAVQNPAGEGIHVVPLSDKLLRSYLVVSFDASLFTWIKKSFFQGEVTYQGRQCLHYQGVAPLAGGDPSESPAKVLHQAWIDAKTHAPVAFDDSHRLISFARLPPPQEPPVMSAAFQAALARYQQALQLPKPFGSLR